MIDFQMAIKFSYFKSDCDRGSNCFFGISSSLTIVAIKILFSKFLSPPSMECGNEISSSEDEFHLSLLNDEITSIHKAIDNRAEKSSDEDTDEVKK